MFARVRPGLVTNTEEEKRWGDRKEEMLGSFNTKDVP